MLQEGTKGDTIFTSPTRDAILRGHPSYARDLAACGAKGVPSLISFFKTLSTAPAHRIERATFRSAVKRSTD